MDVGTPQLSARAISDRYRDAVDLTDSYKRFVTPELLTKYVWYEVRNAGGIIASTNPTAWVHLMEVLGWFELTSEDLIEAGGQESALANRINARFRDRGWREARVDTEIELALALMKFGDDPERITRSKVKNRGFKVDNFIDRVALDVEWNAKDGNLSRDIAAYRALYEYGLIDGAIIFTRTHPDLRQLAYQRALAAGQAEKAAKSRLNTTTTTNLDKLLPMMGRGDAGGCPLIAVAICHRTWPGDSSGVTEPTVSPSAWKEALAADVDIPAGGAGIG